MAKRKRKNNIRYSKLVILGSLLLFCLMIGRIIQLGMSSEIDGVNLKELASNRTTRTETISAMRGSIYSVNGDVLAQNVASYKLIAYLDPKRTTNKKKPQHVVDKEETATKLAPIIGMEKDDVLKYLSKENVYQTEFGTKGKDLTDINLENIIKNTRIVLEQGIKNKGTTIHSFSSLGVIGDNQSHLLVHMRVGKKCVNCNGIIKKIKVNGRGTYYCPNCQKGD